MDGGLLSCTVNWAVAAGDWLPQGSLARKLTVTELEQEPPLGALLGASSVYTNSWEVAQLSKKTAPPRVLTQES
jgi:hypothetical protein